MSFSLLNQLNKSAPNNRNQFVLENGVYLDSMFPSGNIGHATLISSNPCAIQIKGNTDFKNDSFSRYWLYFRLTCDQNIKKIKFILKDANHLRKFVNQKNNKPKIVYKKQGKWNILNTDLQIKLLEDNSIQAYFYLEIQNQGQAQQKKQLFQKSIKKQQIQEQKNNKTLNIEKCLFLKEKQEIYISINYPYAYEDLQVFLMRKTQILNLNNRFSQEVENIQNQIYYNQEILTYTIQRRKISLITITSCSNIQSLEERQNKINQNIFPQQKNRPFKLKNVPIILITARVHPSQISSSFFIQSLINQLTDQSNMISKALLKTFIFMIVPMLNPDGVCNGNYRHDNCLKNLNRYYGDSSFQQTPQIKAVELLVNHYRYCQKQNNGNNIPCNRIMIYLDVHGHQSSRSSFIFGNYTQNIHHMIENRYFCKLIQYSFIKGGFQSNQCQFSKKNMYSKEKYDENSKLFSGRAFVGSQIEESLQENSLTFHSYTLQLVPFYNVIEPQNKNKPQSSIDLIYYCKQFAKSVLNAINILLQIQSPCKNKQLQNLKELRSNSCKQVVIQLQKYKLGQNQSKKFDKKINQVKSIIKIIGSGQYQFFKKSYKSWFKDQHFIEACLKSDVIGNIFKLKLIAKDESRQIGSSETSIKQKQKVIELQQTITIQTKNVLRKQISPQKQHRFKNNILKRTKQQLQMMKREVRDNLKKYTIDDYHNQVLEKISSKKFKKMNKINIGPIMVQDIGRYNQSETKVFDYQLATYKRRKYTRIKTETISQIKQNQTTAFKNLNLRIYKQSRRIQNRIKTEGIALSEQKINNPVLTQIQKHTSLQPRDDIALRKLYDAMNKKRSMSMNKKNLNIDDLRPRVERFSQIQIKSDNLADNTSEGDIIQATFPRLKQETKRFNSKEQGKQHNLQIPFLNQKKQYGQYSNQYCARQKNYLNEVKQILKQKRIQIFKQYKEKKKQFQSEDKCFNTNIFLVSRFKGFINNTKS